MRTTAAAFPFTKFRNTRTEIAIRVLDDRGNELLKIHRLAP
jgi:hypothetical protein